MGRTQNRHNGTMPQTLHERRNCKCDVHVSPFLSSIVSFAHTRVRGSTGPSAPRQAMLPPGEGTFATWEGGRSLQQTQDQEEEGGDGGEESGSDSSGVGDCLVPRLVGPNPGYRRFIASYGNQPPPPPFPHHLSPPSTFSPFRRISKMTTHSNFVIIAPHRPLNSSPLGRSSSPPRSTRTSSHPSGSNRCVASYPWCWPHQYRKQSTHVVLQLFHPSPISRQRSLNRTPRTVTPRPRRSCRVYPWSHHSSKLAFSTYPMASTDYLHPYYLQQNEKSDPHAGSRSL